jgi:hypothetical protein
MLKQLRLTLDARTAALSDCNGELKTLSQKISDYTNDWCPGSSYAMAYGSKHVHIPDDFYVINCPELHPLPAKNLYDGLSNETIEGRKLQVRLLACAISPRRLIV